MPTFGGKLLEEGLNIIRIDNFEEENFDGRYFFLTHPRIDQVKGLYGFNFAEQLINNDEKMLCCSPLTKEYLLNDQKCRIPSTKIFEMSLNTPYVFCPENQPRIEVSLISSGHCSGSVMIYMVQAGRRVLYTGDFRETAFKLNKYSVFKNSFGAVVPIHTLYLDITFCDPKWLSFPDRLVTHDDILAIILDWTLEDPNHEIGLWYTSHHGLESLLLQLAVHKLIKTKVWIIEEEAYAHYSCITGLQDFISNEREGSRIHICTLNSLGNCFVCTSNRASTVTIKLVTMTYQEQQLYKSGNKEETSNVMEVAYSTHCSLVELINIYKFFNPLNVVPCVTRPGGITDEQVQQDLQNLQLDIQKYVDKLKEEKKKNHPENHPEIPPSMRHSFFMVKKATETTPSSLVRFREIKKDPKFEEDEEMARLQSQISEMDIVNSYKTFKKRKPRYFPSTNVASGTNL